MTTIDPTTSAIAAASDVVAGLVAKSKQLAEEIDAANNGAIAPRVTADLVQQRGNELREQLDKTQGLLPEPLRTKLKDAPATVPAPANPFAGAGQEVADLRAADQAPAPAPQPVADLTAQDADAAAAIQAASEAASQAPAPQPVDASAPIPGTPAPQAKNPWQRATTTRKVAAIGLAILAGTIGLCVVEGVWALAILKVLESTPDLVKGLIHLILSAGAFAALGGWIGKIVLDKAAPTAG